MDKYQWERTGISKRNNHLIYILPPAYNLVQVVWNLFWPVYRTICSNFHSKLDKSGQAGSGI